MFLALGKAPIVVDCSQLSDATSDRVSLRVRVYSACDTGLHLAACVQAIDFTEARLQEGKSCQSISEELVNEALNMGSTDNITALLITLK